MKSVCALHFRGEFGMIVTARYKNDGLSRRY